MSDSSSAAGSRSPAGGGGDYDGQGSPVAYRVGPLAYQPAVHCECKVKLKACRWKSWSDAQPGRRYHRCQRSRVRGLDCGFFHWLDEEVSDWYKEVMRDLRDAVWGLKKEVAKAEANLEVVEKKLVVKQTEVEEMKNELEVKQFELHVKNRELIATHHQFTAMQQELIAKHQELQLKDEEKQALEAKLKSKNKCIDVLVVFILVLVVILLFMMLNANKNRALLW